MKKSNFKSQPAPIGGWNAKDSWAAMPPTEAVILTNFFPNATSVEIRKGSTTLVGGFTQPVETVMAFTSASVAEQLFAVSGGTLYQVSAGSKVSKIAGLLNSQWQYTNMANSAGNWLHAVNGTDPLMLYDGTTWKQITGASSPAITGVTTSDLINVCLHQSRLWFIQKNSMKVWYLAANAVSGAATLLDLSAVFRNGGYLVAMGSWTLDAGSGMDDHAVFISSTGEIAVYQGTDPASASTWGLVGRYRVGAPISYRCLEQYASDLLIISQDGLLPMSKALASSRVTTNVSLTDKIQKPTAEATTLYAANFGWDVVLFPSMNALILNVPVSGGSHQFVMNTITGAWTRFTGWSSYCWLSTKTGAYFGSDTAVIQAFYGSTDDGSAIQAEAVPAFNYFRSSNTKLFSMARLNIRVDGQVAFLLDMNVDFNLDTPTGVVSAGVSPSSAWDTAIWDTALWAGDIKILQDWQTVFGHGRAGTVHLLVSSQAQAFEWLSSDLLFEFGDAL